MLILFRLLSLCFILVLAAGSGLYLYAEKEIQKPVMLEESVLFEIHRGQGLSQIAYRLEQAGIISSPLLLKYAAWRSEQAGRIKAGEYEIFPQMHLTALLDHFVQGEVYQRSVTIPEGLTNFEVYTLLRQAENIEPAANYDIPFKEGSLLPDTYYYDKNTAMVDILNRMSEAQVKFISKNWHNRQSDLPYTSPREALIMASIIEKETSLSEEMDEVSGVFINRLRIGMPLQSDPTVIYAITRGQPQTNGAGPLGRRLTRQDWELENPYNTYQNKGLPPGPISNPGRQAILAALNPADHNYLYFVSDGTGGHAFARTLEEHNRNVSKWRKIRDGK